MDDGGVLEANRLIKILRESEFPMSSEQLREALTLTSGEFQEQYAEVLGNLKGGNIVRHTDRGYELVGL